MAISIPSIIRHSTFRALTSTYSSLSTFFFISLFIFIPFRCPERHRRNGYNPRFLYYAHISVKKELILRLYGLRAVPPCQSSLLLHRHHLLKLNNQSPLQPCMAAIRSQTQSLSGCYRQPVQTCCTPLPAYIRRTSYRLRTSIGNPLRCIAYPSRLDGCMFRPLP